MIKKNLLSVLTLVLIVSLIPAQDIDKTKIPELNLERPDIVVEKIKLTKMTSSKRGKVRLKIELWLANNSSKPTRCCPTIAGEKAWNDHPSEEKLFRVRVDAKYDPSGLYFKVGGTSTELKPSEKNYRCQFFGYFDLNKTLRIRVIADYGNWINEKNENNNMKRMNWPLRVKTVN